MTPLSGSVTNKSLRVSASAVRVGAERRGTVGCEHRRDGRCVGSVHVGNVPRAATDRQARIQSTGSGKNPRSRSSLRARCRSSPQIRGRPSAFLVQNLQVILGSRLRLRPASVARQTFPTFMIRVSGNGRATGIVGWIRRVLILSELLSSELT
jgi:hypothetical protein